MTHNGLLFVTEPGQREEAMNWLIRLSDDDVNESVVSDWLAWYQASPGNKQAFDVLQDFCERCDELQNDPVRASRLSRMASEPERAAGTRSWASTMVESLREIIVRPPWFAIGALSAACAMAVVMSVLRVPDADHSTMTPQAVVETSQVVHETLLPDGSKVELGPRSSIEVAYTDDTRLLQLSSGEGYFSVAPNKVRPFVVKAGDLNVRAVGTEFNVRRADGRVVVTVTKGTVDVYQGASEQLTAAAAGLTGPVPGGVRVSEGNEVTWLTNTNAPTVAAIDPKHAATWRQGRLEYIQEPLASVIADVNRYAPREIVIADKEIGQMSFTGTVLTDDTGEWLRSLPTVFPVNIASNGQRDVLELRAPDTQPKLR